MRVSMHGGHGSAKHNMHLYMPEEERGVKVYTCNDIEDLEESELAFYNDFFGEALEAQNERYRKKGNKSRIRTMEEWQKANQHKPREVIMQIGNMKESVSMDVLEDAVMEYLEWKSERFKDNLEILNVAFHAKTSFEATPHAHIREVWYSRDKNGVKVPGIKKALREAGVPLPDPRKPEDENNYRMAVVDRECREKWQEICVLYGIAIEVDPKERNVGHMGVDAWKAYSQGMEELEEKEMEVWERASAVKTREVKASVKEKMLAKQEQSLEKREESLKERERIIEERERLLEKQEKDSLEKRKEQESVLQAEKDRLERLGKNIEDEVQKRLNGRIRALQTESKQGAKRILPTVDYSEYQ